MPQAVITGAAGGIGQSCANHLIASGWTVSGIDLSPIDVDGVKWYKADVRSLEELSVIASQLPDLELLINAAGISDPSPAESMAADQWRRVVDVCLTGTFFSCKAMYPRLSATGGTVVNVASAAARRATPNHANYCVAKAGVEMLTEVLAVEWSPTIRVVGISPGFVSTELLRRGVPIGSERERRLVATTPMGRIANPEEIAEVILALASDKFSFVTGTTLTIDGGFLTTGGVPQ